jgi:nitrite reductase/ring-hydroxylating ferredoxin subunit/uncharacterized membrane protein
MTSPLPNAVAERLEGAEPLDQPAETIAKVVRDTVPSGAVKDGLSGTWLGHAVHPFLTDLTLGTFTSATLLDLFGGPASEQAADRLIAVGLGTAPATILTGWTDWADAAPARPAVRRAGLIHAVVQATGVGLMAASLAVRRRGARGRGKALSGAGMTLLSVGAWIGGHLSYAQGVAVNTTAFDAGPADWTGTGVTEAELADGRPRCALVGDAPVLLVHQGGTLHALHNRCAHRGGSLAEGEIGDGTVTCPLHGSTFALADGSVEHGPAPYPQPVLEARVVSGGEIEVRLPPGA